MKGRRTALGILVGICLLCQAAVAPPGGGGPPGGSLPMGTLGTPAVPANPIVSPPGVPQVAVPAVKKDKVESVKPEIIDNNAVQTDDSYSLYRNLMDLRLSLESSSNKSQTEKESPALRTIKRAVSTVVETVRHSFLRGFLPAAERHRREADPSKKPYLDGVTYVVGSLLGKQDCSNMIACRAGKFVQTRVPGAQLAVMMMETVVPQSLLSWFGVLKKSVMDRSDQCDNDYDCQLIDPVAQLPVVLTNPQQPRGGGGSQSGANLG